MRVSHNFIHWRGVFQIGDESQKFGMGFFLSFTHRCLDEEYKSPGLVTLESEENTQYLDKRFPIYWWMQEPANPDTLNAINIYKPEKISWSVKEGFVMYLDLIQSAKHGAQRMQHEYTPWVPYPWTGQLPEVLRCYAQEHPVYSKHNNKLQLQSTISKPTHFKKWPISFVKCWETNSILWKYHQRGFIWMVTPWDSVHRFKIHTIGFRPQA